MDKNEIEALFGSDEAIGVMFRINIYTTEAEVITCDEFDMRFGLMDVKDIPDYETIMPDGSSATVCTNYAHHVSKILGGMGRHVAVVGFANEDNPTSRCAMECFHPGGHDFAIVDRRYLVDPWIKLVAAVEDQIFYDLNNLDDAAKAHAIYGPRGLWLPLNSTEIDWNFMPEMPDIHHPHMIFTLSDAVTLATDDAKKFKLAVPTSLVEVRDHIMKMQSRADCQSHWLQGHAALDVLDAAIDGRDIIKGGRLGCATSEAPAAVPRPKPLPIHDIEAHQLRLEALNLLKEAQNIDGLEPLVFVHEHDTGQTCYMGWARPTLNEDENQQWAETLMAAAGNTFEEDRDESLFFYDGDVGLAQLCGCDPNDDEVEQILNPTSCRP